MSALRNILRAVILCYCTLSPTLPLNATTIVAMWTPEHVIIGIDGKITVIGQAGYSASQGCKILQRGNSTYAATGFLSGGGFDLYALISRVKNTDSPQTSVPEIAEAIAHNLTVSLPNMHIVAPREYDKWVTGEDIVILFVGSSGGNSATLDLIFFHLQADRIAYKQVQAGKGNLADPSVIGFSDVLNMKSLGPGWLERDHVAVLREALAKGIADDHARSGLPMSIVWINKNSTKWIEAGECDQKKNNAPPTK